MSSAAFFAGEERIATCAEELLRPLSPHSPVRLMVTLPSEAAEDAAFMSRLAELGVEAARINCAHDDDSAWAQEEILWLGEAAQVPVISATQVLESYLKTGIPSRGEMTDAAMAAGAECVMLNKGPHLFEGIEELDRLLGRMSEHMKKKTPQLRPLKSW